MAVEIVQCPHCQSREVVKYGTASNGKARYRCQQSKTCGRTFLRTYAYPGCMPEVKWQMVEMTLNGSGIRDIARVLWVGPAMVIKELKKSSRTLAGKQSRGGGPWSGRHRGRGVLRGGSRSRRDVEFREEQSTAALVVARH